VSYPKTNKLERGKMSDEQTIGETLTDLEESLKHAIHILTGILNDVATREYTQEQAQVDYENLMWNEGIDFMSALETYALRP